VTVFINGFYVTNNLAFSQHKFYVTIAILCNK